MSESIRKENKMGVMPIPKLLITMSLPMILSMLIQALYNVVDSMFVAQLSEDALTAVSLTFPVQNLIIAISVGTGVGINALLSRYLGEHRYDQANAVAKNGIFITFVSSAIFAGIGILSSHFFFTTQTDNPTIIKYGTTYMFIITLFSFGCFMQITLERLLQATGKTIYNMITQGTGAVINIILDPILIFGLFGFPRLEVAGAAIATIIGQFVAVSLSVYFNCKKNTEIHLNFKNFHPCSSTIKEIYKIGVPSIIMQSIGSIMTFGMNKILMEFSSTATAVFGIYFKLQSFIFMPVFGLTNGMIPIVAYNYGAKNKERIYHTRRLSILIAIAIMTAGLLLLQAIPTQLLNCFDASENMLKIGIPALRIISISFPFAGYCIVCSATFQALGNGVYSLITSAARQLLVILPVAYVFGQIFGLHTIWWSFPIAELVSVFLSVILIKRIFKLKLQNLDS